VREEGATNMIEGHGKLRAELSRLTDSTPDDVVGEERVAAWLHQQIQKVAELKDRYPHGISLEIPWSAEITEANCYIYALGLTPDAIAEWRYLEIQPDTAFVCSILSMLLVEKFFEDATDGDLVIYFDNKGKPRHAGRYRDTKVISKWGNGATHIWKLDLWEAPSDYGNTARVFWPLATEQATTAYVEWAKRQW
jgi:hypothetical protein